MAAQTQKVIARLQETIDSGQYYEAQQQARSFSLRSIRSKKFANAETVIYTISESLLKAGQGAAGADLACLLIECYRAAETRCTPEPRTKVISLLKMIPGSEDPSRVKFLGEAVTWSAKTGDFPAGDSELHHAAGCIYAEESEPYSAERHLILGTAASAPVLGRLEYDWYIQAGPPHAIHLYVSRFLFPYLIVGNVAWASSALSTFLSQLLSSPGAPPSQEIPSDISASGLKVFTSLPLLNFLSLLLQSCQRMSADLYKQLRTHYKPWLDDPELKESWEESLNLIAEMYFGIRAPRQSNPLMDMMGSLLGGGGLGGASQRQERPRVQLKPTAHEPVAEGLD